jgi:hypothetical protein
VGDQRKLSRTGTSVDPLERLLSFRLRKVETGTRARSGRSPADERHDAPGASAEAIAAHVLRAQA